jgi:hypothetical protein
MAYQTQGSLAEVTQGGIGDIVKALQQFLPNMGLNLNDYYRAPSSIGEGQTDGGYLDPALLQKLDDAGYTFGRTGGINQDNYWDVMQGGNVVNRYQTGASSGLDGFMSAGGALLPALGGMAAFGMGGVGGGTGLLGGAGGAAGGGAMSMTDAIAAAGSAGTPGIAGGAGAMSGVGAAGAGGGLFGAGGALSGIGSAAGALGLKPGQLLGGGLGLLAGLDARKDQKSTQQVKMDPRMDAMVYGQGGLLPAAQQWFKGAQNSPAMGLMNQGAQMQANHYGSPQYAQQFGQLRDAGMGLLGRPMAGNPFMKG